MPMWSLNLIIPVWVGTVLLAIKIKEKWENRSSKIRRLIKQNWENNERRQRYFIAGCDMKSLASNSKRTDVIPIVQKPLLPMPGQMD